MQLSKTIFGIPLATAEEPASSGLPRIFTEEFRFLRASLAGAGGPEFDIVPGSYNRHALEDIKFCHLLDSQKHILDFMAYQRTAVISGVAGSGKTLIAIEQATRRAERGRRVLLLCFNALLSEDIARRGGGQPNIDVKTAAAYAGSRLFSFFRQPVARSDGGRIP